MRIITISREFGSGGRELGKRMADLLGMAYYDKEILTAIARKNALDETYVAGILEQGPPRNLPITIGRTFAYPVYQMQNTTQLLVAQQRIIKELAAQGDCVVMGQNADVILKEHGPFNLFVYAGMEAKMQRCRERAPEGERLSDRDLIKSIRRVDAARAKSREMHANSKWGQKENYHLCVNTTGIQIKTLAPQIADYALHWLGMKET